MPMDADPDHKRDYLAVIRLVAPFGLWRARRKMRAGDFDGAVQPQMQVPFEETVGKLKRAVEEPAETI